MIRLIDGYYIDTEDYGYSLCYGVPKKDKNGKLKRNVKGYYGSLGKAIEACRQEIVHDYVKSAEIGLGDALRMIREMSDEFKKKIEEVI